MSSTKQKAIDIEVFAQAAEYLRTIAHACRLKMIEMLLVDEHTVRELAEACEIPSRMGYKHLGLMKDRGLANSNDPLSF